MLLIADSDGTHLHRRKAGSWREKLHVNGAFVVLITGAAGA